MPLAASVPSIDSYTQAFPMPTIPLGNQIEGRDILSVGFPGVFDSKESAYNVGDLS